MIIEQFKEQAGIMYETVREVFQERLRRLDEYIAVYQEAGDLGGLSEEEMGDILPVAIYQQREVKVVVDKLNQVATRDWFIQIIGDQLQDKVTEEDAELLSKALEIQTRIDDIFENGSNELVSYITKDLGQKVVVN